MCKLFATLIIVTFFGQIDSKSQSVMPKFHVMSYFQEGNLENHNFFSFLYHAEIFLIVIYPQDFETKIGFDRIKNQIASLCATEGAKNLIADTTFSADYNTIHTLVNQTHQMKNILMMDSNFPNQGYVDTAYFLKKAEVIGSFLEPSELGQLRNALQLVHDLIKYFGEKDEASCGYLKALLCDVTDFESVIVDIDRIIDRYNHIKDSASDELFRIRQEIRQREGQVSKRLQAILSRAQDEGFVEESVSISIRDGRAVIPVSAANKKKIKGFIHDESASGRTFYVEPIEVVEINNELKELEYAERREVIRILTVFTDALRPDIPEILHSAKLLVTIDFIRAKARHAVDNNCGMPILLEQPGLELRNARHLLLEQTLKRDKKPLIPLDLKLDTKKHILIISGPNAGGKSVCLKTVGLVQYMLQSGLLVSASEVSEIGIFESLFMDMGDEQSIDNDLSTYSSHLTNMKIMLRSANGASMILIDEFGTGTEPVMGGAIAESVLTELERKHVFGVITTHYSNLKYYASSADGVINGAMSFDVQNIRPLFKLEIGKPGSSFAIEIARKIGLPETIIESAKEKIGNEQVNIEKQLREIARDKRYWEGKRDKIRITERKTEEITERYKSDLEKIREQRNQILHEAKQQAERIVLEANRQIENTIREIREVQADKEKTREVRRKFEDYKTDIFEDKVVDNDDIERKIAKIRELEERRAKRREQTATGVDKKVDPKPEIEKPLVVGDKVRIKGQSSMGEIISMSGKKAVIGVGHILTNITIDRIERVSNAEYKRITKTFATPQQSVTNYDTFEKRTNFKPQIDVRGMRAAEALEEVREFIDEAIMFRFADLRILHGKGTGALMVEIRKYLNAIDLVISAKDEHVDMGGSGITVVKLDV